VAAVTRLLVRTMRRRPAVLVTEHNRWPRHAAATRWANRLTMPLDDADVAVSDDVRNSMPRKLRTDVEVLVHGVALDEVRSHAGDRASARAELRTAPREVLAVIVANLRREKGYDVLLAAADHLRRTDPSSPVRFVSVGQGPLEAQLRARHAALGLGDRFLFLGYQPDALRWLAAADLFVLSSRHEGLPVALMEALALGVPVVATEVGGIPQAVTDGVEGLLVPPDRPEKLAAAVATLADDPTRRQAMGEAAFRRSGDFGIEPAQRRYESLYATLRASVGRSR
jgi:glycosyltransferase involved in cell wall biosynthesis